MRSLESRVTRLEHAMMAGKVRENEQDPALVDFMAKFGIPAEECPRGVPFGEWFDDAINGARILGVASRPDDEADYRGAG